MSVLKWILLAICVAAVVWPLLAPQPDERKAVRKRR